MINTKASPSLVVFALIMVQVLFGLNYVISKVVVGVFPPLLWASFRLIIASIFLVGMALVARRKHPKADSAFFIPLIGFSLLGVIINQSSFLVGLRYTTSTNSAILNTLIPVFTLLVVTVRGQEPLTAFRALGFVFSLVGVLVIRNVESFSFSNQTVIGDLLTILNCFSYALFLSYSKRFMEKYDRLWVTTWLFMYGSVGMTTLAVPYWMSFQMPALDGHLVACMVFAILGGTLLTYFLNNWALAHTKSSSVALYIYLQPIIATLLAWAWFGETIHLRSVISCALIFVGMLMAIAGAARKPVPSADRRLGTP